MLCIPGQPVRLAGFPPGLTLCAVFLGWSGSAGYVLVMFWPFEKMGAVPSIILFVALVFLVVTLIFVVNRKKTNTNNPDKNLWLLLVLLCVFPSILLLPNIRFLTARQVLEHTETRLSYIPLIGFSVFMGGLLKNGRDFRIDRIVVPAFLSLLMCFYVWAQQGEISRWTKAGKTAESILNQIVTLASNPHKGATFLFGNPQLMAADRYYYVFGGSTHRTLPKGGLEYSSEAGRECSEESTGKFLYS